MFGNSLNSVVSTFKFTQSKPRIYTLTQLSTISGNVSAVCLNNDCSRAYATNYGGLPYYWTVETNTWTASTGTTAKNWMDMVCDGTGQYVIAITWATTGSSEVYYSSDYGQSFTASTSTFGIKLTSVAMSDNGQYAYIGCFESATASNANRFYKSTDYGVTWSSITNANIPGCTVKCDKTGQYVILYAYIGLSGGSAPAISRDYGVSFAKPGGANAGQYGSKVYINTNGNTAWYFFSFSGGSWTPITKQQYNGTTLGSINCTNTPSSTSASPYYRTLDCTTDGKIIMTIDNFANGSGSIYICTNGIAPAVYGATAATYSSEFSNFTQTNGLNTANWKDVYCSYNDSFIFANQTQIYLYSWTT